VIPLGPQAAVQQLFILSESRPFDGVYPEQSRGAQDKPLAERAKLALSKVEGNLSVAIRQR